MKLFGMKNSNVTQLRRYMPKKHATTLNDAASKSNKVRFFRAKVPKMQTDHINRKCEATATWKTDFLIHTANHLQHVRRALHHKPWVPVAKTGAIRGGILDVSLATLI